MNDLQIAPAQRLTLVGLLAEIVARRKAFAATALATVAALLAYAFLATPEYRGVVKLLPRQNEMGGEGLSSMLSQFGGLAAIAGLGFSSVNEQESIELLKSRALFTQFVDSKNLLPILFSKKWDAQKGAWRTDLKHPPTMDDAWIMFDRDIRRVTVDTKTRVITLDITWKDRKQAAAWANELARLANEDMRERAMRESAASIASFESQLANTDVVELRQAIYKLMQAQYNRTAVAKSRADYALNVIDPATVPDERRFVSPRRLLIAVISVPLGLFLAVALVLALRSGKRMRAQLRNAVANDPGAY